MPFSRSVSGAGDVIHSIARLVNGERVTWDDIVATGGGEQFLDRVAADEIDSLVYLSIKAMAEPWSGRDAVRVVDELARRARADAAAELLRGREAREMLDALADAGVRAVLLKGTPLAYTVYRAPACRSRSDTDLFVQATEVDAARRVFAARGYAATVQCHDLLAQFDVQREDRFGVTHAFDVHWRISTQPVFADLLSYDDADREAVAVPALGARARALGLPHALLVACVHPVMHHQNAERLLWVYDIHLLASRAARVDFDAFVELATSRRVAEACASQLRRAVALFGTEVPGEVFERLRASGEPSAAYLAAHRRWHHELASSLRGLPSWGERLRHLRDVLFPSPQYMLGSYGLSGNSLTPLLLPALYVHRQVNGVWKILSGKK